MDRARRAGLTALIVVVLVAPIAGLGGPRVLAGVVGWPPSTLVISEFQTGGASASDEFVEVANQGQGPADLAGLEVVYATASGSTITRKATWAAGTMLGPGRRILLANGSGVYAAVADATYSGGFAATGGAIALRVVGGNAIDAIGWGDATNALVEGTAASAPESGSSLERAPGGMAGNGTDTNDNALDWFVQAAPSPQGLSAPAVPEPGPSATPTAMPVPSPTTTPVPPASATPRPTASATPVPTVSPTPQATATPTPTPPASATPAPTPPATAVPTPPATPNPTPAAAPRPIAEARGVPDGTAVTIQGVLTTPLGALESGRGGFVQDATGGIALYLDVPVAGVWPAGTTITVEGTLSSRFSQRTLRIAEGAVVAGPPAAVPVAVEVMTGSISEGLEGLRVRVTGTIDGAPDQLADGLGLILDDGTGPVRVVVGLEALVGRSLASGMLASVTGPLGQRDSSGTGSGGYRIHTTLAGELELPAPQTASPTPSPSPTPTATAQPTATPTITPGPTHTEPPTPTPDPTPTQTPSATLTPMPTALPSASSISIDAVRALALGSNARTSGVVVAEAGRLGTPSLLAIADATGGLVVHLPSGAGSYARGSTIEVVGRLAAPYGQLEIRPSRGDIRALGSGALPETSTVAAAGLAEPDEARLVTTTGRLAEKPKRTAGGDVTVILERPGATPVKVMADVSSRITVGSFRIGATYRVVGVVGQRASRSGALDGYRIWARDGADLVVAASPPPGATPSPGASGSPSPTAPTNGVQTVTIARALGIIDRSVAFDAVVTAPATLLDATGRRIVVQDATAAVEVLLPTGTVAPPVGARIHAEGRIGVAYGAPRLRADRLVVDGSGALPAPLVLRGMPGKALEWRLVTVSGRVSSVRKLGERWRAEILVGVQKVVVVGQPGAGIASTTLMEGRAATVVGIVRRPYPSASDHRFAVTPRFPADIRLAGGNTTGSGPGAGTGSGLSGAAGGPAGSNPAIATDPAGPAAPDANLVDLGGLVGRRVRVGGLVVELRPDGFTLDDGTAIGRIVVRGAAVELLTMVEPDDALNAVGRVEATPDGPVVAVDDPGGIIGAGDPTAGSAIPASDDPVTASPSAEPSVAGGRIAGLGGTPWPVDAGAAGLGTLVAISALSLAVTVLRRAQARRRLATRIAARLATFAGPSASRSDANVAERDSSTIHSA